MLLSIRPIGLGFIKKFAPPPQQKAIDKRSQPTLPASGGRVKAPSVLQTMDRKQAVLIAVVVAGVLAAVVHTPVVGEVAIVL
jgi:hypothetical protein